MQRLLLNGLSRALLSGRLRTDQPVLVRPAADGESLSFENENVPC